jgi:hypothetical protein
MLTEIFQSLVNAARRVFRNWRWMLLLAVVYASLLAILYFFVAVREASLAQVGLTFALAIVAPLLFFVLQAMIATGIASKPPGDSDEQTVGVLLRKSLTSFWKLIVVTLPLIALAVLIAYLLGKAQAHVGSSLNEAAAQLPRPMSATARAREVARPIDWKAAMLSTVRYLLFGLVLPLMAIHLWLATVREGLGAAIKKIGTHLSRAFAPQSVLIYVVGFLIFGLIPYLLLFRTTPNKHAWLELFLFVARMAVVFALTLFGWVITVRALALWSTRSPDTSANEVA